MSRKNLSRTVIEGGRYYHNCFLRRASNGQERATTREWLDRVAVDLEEAEESAPSPRKRVYKMFHDRLGPAKRWLLSQVGRPWAKVYSELCAKFDTRTVAGRHVVHDHMLHWVRRYDDVDRFQRWHRFELVIDKQGILRKPMYLGRSYEHLERDVLAWANQRVCSLTSRGWWWFRREGIGASCEGRWRCGKPHHFNLVTGHKHGGTHHAFRYVSVGPVSRGQLRYMERLPADLRARLVIASPWK